MALKYIGMIPEIHIFVSLTLFKHTNKINNLKPTNKGAPIRDLSLTDEHLVQIQDELKSNDFNLFTEMILKPINPFLENWIKEEYTILIDDKADIMKGVERRIKNEIVQHDFSSGTLNIQEVSMKYIQLECESNLPTESNIKKNLGLTKKEFKRLVAELKNGNEAIIEKVYLSHFEKCIAIIVRHTNCNKEEAYDCSMEALIDIRLDLLRDKILYGNLESYFTTKAINKFYRRGRKKKIETLPIVDGMNFPNYIESSDELIEKDLKRLVAKAIMQLGEECQFILKQYYYNNINMNEIGEKINKNHDAVRKQASRCRGKLKLFISGKIYQQFSSFFS